MEHQYIISDVSRILDIEPHVLRYWEEELGLTITRNKLGHRYYSEADLTLLKKVKALKEQGLQLKAIRVLLESDMHEKPREDRQVENSKENMMPEGSQGHDMTLSHSGQAAQKNEKLIQFQEFLKSVMTNTLRENNYNLIEDIRSEFSINMNELLQRQEALDEKRYRKLDETIREMQKMRQETAVTKKPNWFVLRKKDKPE